jgi:hypothetical protein
VTDATKRAELNDWLAHKVRPTFEQRVLPVTEEIMFKWRLLVKDGRTAGYTFSQPDLIIAATALHHGLTVVTCNVSDYEWVRAHGCSIPGAIRCRQALREGVRPPILCGKILHLEARVRCLEGPANTFVMRQGFTAFPCLALVLTSRHQLPYALMYEDNTDA